MSLATSRRSLSRPPARSVGADCTLAQLHLRADAGDWRGGRQRRVLRGMSGRRLQPVPVQAARGQEGWTVTPVGGTGRPVRQLPAEAELFRLDLASGLALGVSLPGAPVFPLDRELRWADVTEERAPARAGAAWLMGAPFAIRPEEAEDREEIACPAAAP